MGLEQATQLLTCGLHTLAQHGPRRTLVNVLNFNEKCTSVPHLCFTNV